MRAAAGASIAVGAGASASSSRRHKEFSEWLRAQKKRYWLGGVGIGTLISAATNVGQLWNKLPADTHQLIARLADLVPTIANLLFIVFALFFVHRGVLPARDALPRASRAVRQLHLVWELIWLSWLLFYGGLLAQTFFPSVALQVAINLLSNIQGSLFFCAYFVMSERTIDQTADGMKLRREGIPWPLIIAVPLVIAGAQLAGTLGRGSSPFTFNLIVGLWSCIALALFTGRMESKLIDLPAWPIVLMYCYAALQTVWAVPDHHLVTWLGITVAALLKLVLFAVGFWFLGTDAALFYFHRMDGFDPQVRSDRRSFRDALHRNATPLLDAGMQYEVFFSAAMAALPEAEMKAARQDASEILDLLQRECGVGSAHYAGQSASAKRDFDLEDESFISDTKALAGSRYFVLWYPTQLPSSILVEAGMALAMKKPSIYLVRRRDDLPFLLKGAAQANSALVRIVAADDIDTMKGLLRKNWKKVIESLDAQREQ